MRSLIVPILALTCGAATPTMVVEADEPDTNEQIEFFEGRIRPVLVERCYRCHSAQADELKGGLRLDSRDGLRQGGDSGPAVVPGQTGESLLLDALRYDGLEMPPDGKLADEVIADFERWVASGAADPRVGAVVERPAFDLESARQYWAFQPPRRSSPPPPAGRDRARHQPIDAFVLARLRESGLEPGPEADRRTLVRRLTFDLLGLPPTPDEIRAFQEDDRPDAYERLVDRLLASPHYGERLARLWLDLARYAEDQAHIVGNDTSLFFPNAYRYRQWVIESFNRDLPYDAFVVRQLAADLVDGGDPGQLVALGFLGLGPKYYRRGALDVMADEWEDRVDTVTRGLLGLTVACARCHDHKFDPIPTDDYYALAGIFASTEMFNAPLDATVETEKDGQAKKPDQSMHIVREAKPTDLTVFIRGNVENPGPTVRRRFLRVLGGERAPFDQGSGRLELARAITDADNPLTARVLVNRVWGLHFGQPLVATPSNFGHLGERPSHEALLDDLAVRFRQSGQSLKWLQRELVLSATYRQSSADDAAKRAVDPQNRLLWRMPRRRLTVEQWRDAVLSYAGQLDRQLGGPSLDPADPASRRRTIYAKVSRFELDPMLAMFDYPDPNVHADARNETTTPLQKLFVMNSPFMVEQSQRFADRIVAEGGETLEERIGLAYELAFGRRPADHELRLARDFFAEGHDGAARWPAFAQVLLAANETFFID